MRFSYVISYVNNIKMIKKNAIFICKFGLALGMFFSYVISYVNNIKMIKKMRFSYVNFTSHTEIYHYGRNRLDTMLEYGVGRRTYEYCIEIPVEFTYVNQ